MKKITLVDKISGNNYVLPNGNRMELIVGRGGDSDVVIPDCPMTSTVSRKHCTIYKYEDGTAFVSDNVTPYGTYLNWKQLRVGREREDGTQLRDVFSIRNGDNLRLGDYELEVKVEEELPANCIRERIKINIKFDYK